MAIQSHKLEIEYDFNFILLGIVSAAREYKLAWNLNKTLGINLKKEHDAVIEFKNKNNLQVSFLNHEANYHEVTQILNACKETANGKRTFLIPELSNYDYFLKLEGPHFEDAPDHVITAIKKLPVIQYVSNIEVNTLKSRNNLLF